MRLNQIKKMRGRRDTIASCDITRECICNSIGDSKVKINYTMVPIHQCNRRFKITTGNMPSILSKYSTGRPPDIKLDLRRSFVLLVGQKICYLLQPGRLPICRDHPTALPHAPYVGSICWQMRMSAIWFCWILTSSDEQIWRSVEEGIERWEMGKFLGADTTRFGD